jgi:hypothetical protein
VFNATISSISAISWRPVLVVEEAGVPVLKIDYLMQTLNLLTHKIKYLIQ